MYLLISKHMKIIADKDNNQNDNIDKETETGVRGKQTNQN